MLSLITLASSVLGAPVSQNGVVLIDGKGTAFRKTVNQVSPSSLIGAMRALAGFPVDEASSVAVESVLSSEALFRRPKTLVSLHVLGLDVSSLSKGSSGQVAQFVVDQQANYVQSAQAVLALGQRSLVSHGALDSDALQGCAGECAESQLQKVLALIQAKKEGTKVTLSNGAVLSTEDALHRAFLNELTAVARGFALAASRPAPEDGRTELFEGVLASLQALRNAKSPAYEGAAAALSVTLRAGLDSLSAARNQEVAALIVATGDLAASAKPQEMMLLRGAAVTKRRLQARIQARKDEGVLSRYDYNNRFGMGITLIIFLVCALAGVYGMMYMPFAPDALLFPKRQY